MGVVHFLTDRLTNLVSKLGTGDDKASHTQFHFIPLSDQQLLAAYRSSWLPRKIVDIPALDATRRWRRWQAAADEISAIEAEEKRLGIKLKVQQALVRSGLFGGAAIYIGIENDDPELPIDLNRIKRGSLQFLTLLSRHDLSPGPLVEDPLDPRYGTPEYFDIQGAGSVARIHPSRLVIFKGAPLPDDRLVRSDEQAWGDSRLQAVYDQLIQAGGTSANIASLVFEAKVDVFKVPGFMEGLTDPAYEQKVLDRVRLAARAKGNIGALLMDAEEDYEQKQLNFAGMTDVLMAFMQLTSGAADIPITRLLGQSPGGLNSSGEHDLKNYYDRVSSAQELEVEPAIELLDEILIRSSLGQRPDELHYVWASLWQTSDEQKSQIGERHARSIKALAETRLIPEEALSKAAVNVMTESGVMPGLEAAVAEWVEGTGANEIDEEIEAMAAEERAAQFGDAAPRTLYVSRRVLNADEILAWAREQGMSDLLPADKLHVTVAFSRTPVDWMAVYEDYSGSDGEIEIAPGGPRMVERLGENGEAVVLLFNANDLSWRHREILEAGASWDWPEFQPHVTLSWGWGGDIDTLVPYTGRIVLGPEIFEEVDPAWREKVEEER